MSAGRAVAEDVSVVIPTLGRDLLRGCLESIRSGATWPAELIVVDQSQNPEVERWVDALTADGLEVVHLRSNQHGIAAATNRGLERVRTPYTAITHDDCRAREDWIGQLAARVRNVGDAIVTGRVEPEGEGLVLTVITRAEPAVYKEPLIDGDVLFPANMGFPIRLLERIGYLDEHPSLNVAGEDNDWAYRALRAGVPIIYEPGIVVGHLAWQDPSQRTALYRRYARGQGSFYGKHLRRGDLFIARRVLRDLVRAPWLLLRGVATGNRELFAMGVGEVTGLLPGLVAGLGNRGHRVPRAPASSG
ncbi:MAG TPA: glycosyltransferase [Actinomycetota bacterium]